METNNYEVVLTDANPSINEHWIGEVKYSGPDLSEAFKIAAETADRVEANGYEVNNDRTNANECHETFPYVTEFVTKDGVTPLVYVVKGCFHHIPRNDNA